MRRPRDRAISDRLRRVAAPDEAGAQDRAWELIRAAYAERASVPRRRSRTGRLVLALAGGLAVLAIGFSPAGAKVADLVSETIGIGEEDAKPALRSLPAAGELLVESAEGIWVVREDGSKRLLGDYREATWSPRGLYVAAADGRQLVALDPLGEVRWTVGAPGTVHDPRWGGVGFDTRIAYRAGDDLRVVAGDGTGDTLIARDVARVAPVWLPSPAKAKVEALAARHLLAYLDRGGEVRIVDADSGATVSILGTVETEAADELRGAVPARSGHLTAQVTRQGNRSKLVLRDGQRREVLFAGPGDFTQPAWSPDGEWLLVGWRQADQWLFIPVERPRRVIAVEGIRAQFDPGGSGAATFPRPVGWTLPER